MALQDVSKFSISSSHRMPTISASQALESINTLSRGSHISTGLPKLDLILDGRAPDSQTQQHLGGGLPRRQICEVYGPPGVGKTALAMQSSANALRAGNRVVWVDCACPAAGPRLRQVLSEPELNVKTMSSSPQSGKSTDELLANFDHYTAPTLPHLAALLFHPVPSFPPPGTSLIVIESMSSLFAVAFPKATDDQPNIPTEMRSAPYKADAKQWASSRRFAIMSDFAAMMGRLAAVHNLAILVTNQTTTRVKAETGALLVPALSSTAWDGAMASQIALFRDFTLSGSNGSLHSRDNLAKTRFARVVRAGGLTQAGSSSGNVVSFFVEAHGLREMDLATDPANLGMMPVFEGLRKRKQDEMNDDRPEDDVIEDSEDDYGWAEDDDVVAEGLKEQNAMTLDEVILNQLNDTGG